MKKSIIPQPYFYHTHCSRVIDGDTIRCSWTDLGFYTILKNRTYRLARINCPETRTKDLAEKKKGLKAKNWLKEKIQGKDIIIQTFKSDAFGRYLAEVWVGNLNINDKIVELKLGKFQKY